MCDGWSQNFRGEMTRPKLSTVFVHDANAPWWCRKMETFSVLLAICAGNLSVIGGSFDAFFDLRLNKRLSKQSWGWWSQTPSRSLWRHCNVRSRCQCVKNSYRTIHDVTWTLALWPSDAMWRHWPESALDQVMACVWQHQCRLIIREVQRHPSYDKFTRDT